jgi:hypothetical protein
VSGLPAWAAAPQCRSLLSQLIVEHPPVHVYDDGLSAWNGRRVRGETAKAIRALYDAWYDAQIDACSSLVHGSPEYHELRDATLAIETADRLMERLLTEQPGVVENRGDGWARWAA